MPLGPADGTSVLHSLNYRVVRPCGRTLSVGTPRRPQVVLERHLHAGYLSQSPVGCSNSRAISSISFRSSIWSTSEIGMAEAPQSAPRIPPVIAPVLSLSPEWLMARDKP